MRSDIKSLAKLSVTRRALTLAAILLADASGGEFAPRPMSLTGVSVLTIIEGEVETESELLATLVH